MQSRMASNSSLEGTSPKALLFAFAVKSFQILGITPKNAKIVIKKTIMITIYKSDGTIRIAIHESADSYVNPKISDEEYAQINFISGDIIPFEVGDYVSLYGMYYTLLKVPTPLKKLAST